MPTSPFLSAPGSLLSLCWQGRYPDLRRMGWITTVDPTFFVQPVLFPSPTLAGMVFWPVSCKEKSSVVSLGPGLLERKPLAIVVVHTPRSFSVLLATVVEKYDAVAAIREQWDKTQEHHGDVSPAGAGLHTSCALRL